ncbi:hypothetical protein G6F35_009332 [Rhizopus arrhizus]|nr:hypothetical protein G6F15_010745 [Rhizopus arrhizus]KAG1217243.1 hypothetical protein G6F35_009332 [Rhizopus arrhizus]
MDYPEYVALYYYITRGTLPIDCDQATGRKIKSKASKYLASRGKLFRKNKNEDSGEENFGREVLHEGNIDDIILKVHKEGHHGIKNTYHKLSLQYEGRKMYERTVDMVRSCEICQKRQITPKKKIIKMRPIPTPHRPFYMVGLDAVGPIEEEGNEFKYMLVCVDYLTRWPIAAAVRDITALTTDRFLYNYLFMHHGIPSYLLTDRGTSFKAEYIDYILKKLECRHLITCAYRPQSNGMVERMNQTLVQTISKLKNDDRTPKYWNSYINAALFSIRTMINDSTRFTPAMLLYGYELRTPANWPAPRYDYVEGEIHEEVKRRTLEIDMYISRLRQDAVDSSNQKKEKMKKRYDQEVTEVRRFEIGDLVLMKDHTPKDKFAYKWLGPFEVVKVNKNHTYHLVGPNSRRIEEAVNGHYLLPFKMSKRFIPDVQYQSKVNGVEAWLEKQTN